MFKLFSSTTAKVALGTAATTVAGASIAAKRGHDPVDTAGKAYFGATGGFGLGITVSTAAAVAAKAVRTLRR